MSTSPVIDVHDNLRLLGTAHIATASVEAVRHQIATYQPDVVAVELCKSRYDALVSDRRLDKEGLLKVIKEGKAPMVLMQSMLSAEQQVGHQRRTATRCRIAGGGSRQRGRLSS